ncbi:hypothetical protein FE243_08005 [Aliarcobacter thereius]|uniref:glycoside hydrolase family 19 protein n=1 Tax=Aliarcobacter thereius TaxID=544718 RepID=UPI0010FF3D35|nr:hypothetical protein [Aliarcobacter thereius]TLT06521.1 hypothetical protein FE243_08005 [Aliarcobacter thereius]
MLKKSIYENVILDVDAMFDDGKMLKGSIALVTKEYDIKLPEDKNKKEYILFKEEFTVEVKDDRAEYKFVIKKIIDDNNIRQEDIAYVKGWIDVDGEGEYDIEYDLEVFLEIELITKDMLVAMGCVKASEKEDLIKALNKYCKQYEINTPIRIAHFLSQTAHESGGFKKFEEGVNYRHIAAKSFSKYNQYYTNLENIHGKEKAMDYNKFFSNGQKYLKQPELFNLVYSDENGNGDEQSGDGYIYRGRGLIQITGREKYQGFTNEHNKRNPEDYQNFVENPDLVALNMDYIVASACWYWRNKGALSKQFNAKGDINIIIDNAPDDVKLVSQAVNGGVYGKSNGYDDLGNSFSRLPLFNKIKEYMKL